MIISAILVIVSTGLLLWWFRYSCRLILSAPSARDYTKEVAQANELRFLEVQQDLVKVSEPRQLDSLEEKLQRDYTLLNYLLQHGPAFLARNDRLEHRLLALHFHLMRAWYAVNCKLSLSTSRHALEEMTQVIGYFANKMGERCALAAK